MSLHLMTFVFTTSSFLCRALVVLSSSLSLSGIVSINNVGLCLHYIILLIPLLCNQLVSLPFHVMSFHPPNLYSSIMLYLLPSCGICTVVCKYNLSFLGMKYQDVESRFRMANVSTIFSSLRRQKNSLSFSNPVRSFSLC